MENRQRNFGFTLIELIMVIIILGILAVVAIPQFFNLAGDAEQAAEEGVVGGVRAGIQTYMANDTNHAWPPTLDAAAAGACSPTNACFDNVLAQGGVTSGGWVRGAANWTGPNAGVYTYAAGTGEFSGP